MKFKLTTEGLVKVGVATVGIGFAGIIAPDTAFAQEAITVAKNTSAFSKGGGWVLISITSISIVGWLLELFLKSTKRGFAAMLVALVAVMMCLRLAVDQIWQVWLKIQNFINVM